MKIDVFVSYHTETARDVADAVVAKLEQQGLRCWYASRDAEGRFAGNIKRAIDRSSIFVVLLNKAASDSRHVKNEIAIAFDNEDLEIIPLRITNEPISDDVDYYLHGFNYINAVGSSYSTGMDELTRRVLKALGRTMATKIETIKYDDGRVYTGEVVNGKRHGKGKMVWPNGDVYEGDWKDNKQTGRGKFVWGESTKWAGHVFEGDFKNGNRTGKGIHLWPNGNRYEGDFLDTKLHGKGTYFYANGDIYEGDYVNGLRTGYGTFTFANGKVLSGRFESDKFLGK